MYSQVCILVWGSCGAYNAGTTRTVIWERCEVHGGWMCFTLSVACWGAVAAAREGGELQSLWSCPVSDTSEDLELGQGWDSEGSSKQAERKRGRGREKLRRADMYRGEELQRQTCQQVDREKQFVREQLQLFHSSQQLVGNTAKWL